jgi:exopolysaccharide biosynthesis polyprenyl glycosylphosphotransferase
MDRIAGRRPSMPAARASQSLSPSQEGISLTLVLLGADTLAITVGFILAYVVRFSTGWEIFYEDAAMAVDIYRNLALWMLPCWLTIFALFRLYDRQSTLRGTQEYAGVVNASTMGMMVVVFTSFVEPGLVVARGWLLLSWFFVIVLDILARFGVRRVIALLRARGHLMRPTVIVGAGPEGRAIAEQLACAPSSGLAIIGFLDDALPPHAEVVAGLRVLGPIDALSTLVSDQEVSEVILVPDAIPRDRLVAIFQTYGTSPSISMRLASGIYEIMTTGMRVREFGNVPLLSLDRVRLTGLSAFLKGALDYALALTALTILAPLLLLTALLVKLDSPGPVIYRRRVIGLGGKAFDAYKFRTMVTDADAVLTNDAELRQRFDEQFKLKDDPRVTRIGRFLRRSSLDELPQLVNVLRGEMGIVGPRMITQEELARYGKWGMNLLTVKPGITGLWQVSGRCDLSYDERVSLDMYYIRNYSIWLDLQLLFRTIPAVIRGHGAY